MGRLARVLIAVGCVIAIAAAVSTRIGRGDRVPAHAPTTGAAVASDASGALSASVASGDSSATPDPLAPKRPDAAPPSERARAPDDSPPDAGVLLAATFVDPHGDPVAGAQVFALHDERAREWTWDPLGESAAAGRFAGMLANPRPECVVEVFARGFEPSRFVFRDLGPGTNDVGALVLRRGATLRGRVVDPAGAPIDAAAVVAEGAVATLPVLTDASGAFTLDGVAPGFVELAARKEEYVRATTQPVRCWVPPVAAAAREPVVLTLVPALPIEGRVREVSGRSVAGVLVFAHAGVASGAAHWTTTCDADGRFALQVPADATDLRLGVEASRHVPTGPPPVAAPGARNVELVVAELPSVELAAIDAADGSPAGLSEIRLYFSPSSDAAPPDASTDEALAANYGRPTSFAGAELAALRVAPGRYRVPFGMVYGEVPSRQWHVIELRSDRHRDHRSAPIALDLNGGSRCEFRLAPRRMLRGTVRDAGGAPMAGATVRCREAAPGGSMLLERHRGVPVLARGTLLSVAAEREVTDARGSFRVPLPESLPPGARVILSASARDHACAPQELVLASRGDTTADLVLRAGGFVEGTITGLDGGSASGEAVVAHDAAGNVATAHSGAEGRYRIGPLPPGAVRVRLGVMDLAAEVESLEGRNAPPPADLFDVAIAEGRATRCNFDLRAPPGLCVAGTVAVEGAAGSALADGIALVAVRESGPAPAPHGLAGSGATHAFADRRGWFRFVDLAPGTWRISIRGLEAQPGASALAVVTLEHGATVHLEGIARNLIGRVVDGVTRDPLATLVTLSSQPLGRRVAQQFTRAKDGAFAFTGVSPGLYRVTWLIENEQGDGATAAPEPVLVDLRAGDVTDLELGAAAAEGESGHGGAQRFTEEEG